MNALAPQSPQLPAYMQALAARSQGNALLQNVSAGASIHQIGIKGARFRLQKPDGSEEVVQTLYLDVIVVDANPNLSKVYYLGAYNPAEEGKGPDCYSDNGVAPSQRASKPQHTNCAQCPHNVWGSHVTANGSQTKSCADSRKMAVVLADNPTGPVYLLKVPAASIKNSRDYAEAIINRGIPIEGIITRLQFDPSADYPKIIFSATNWAAEHQVIAVMKVAGTEETKTVIGLNDKPRVETIAAPIATPAASSVAALPLQPAYVNPATANIAPAPAAVLHPPAHVTPGPLANFPAAPVGQPVMEQAATPVPAKRTRKKAEAPVPAPQPAFTQPAINPEHADIPAHMAGAAAGHVPSFSGTAVFDQPNAMGAAAAVTISPQPTNAALDQLLAQAMSA